MVGQKAEMETGRAESAGRELFEAKLPLVEEILERVRRRHRLGEDDAEEFRAWAFLRLVEGDYRVFRRFRGRASWRTYLAMVIHRLLLDFRVERWGKWRPSARAKRGGAAAEELERLHHRDGFPLAEAVEMLRRNDAVRRPAELWRVADELPQRAPRAREEGEVPELPAPSRTDRPLVDRARARVARRVSTVLARLLAALPAEERLLLRLRFQEGLTVTRIAARLGCDRRPLYTRLAGLVRRLRRGFEEEGLSGPEVLDVVGWNAEGAERDEGIAEGILRT